ncbi:MAG: response regulator transcription factor [Anaerolineaceae bacterium]|nr:response regulator transcription factor [Anaerolineaceae bacterium]
MSFEKAINVLLVDDHRMVRKGLITFLKNKGDIQVVAEADNGQEALDFCRKTKPDVILMDLIMPEMGGVAATRIIHREFPDIQIIALTSFQEKKLVQDALQAGAIGYLLKNISGDELAEAIRSAFAGRATLAHEAVQVLIQNETEEVNPGKDLTRREREVLSLLVKGLSNVEIASQLIVSRSTIKAHVSNILSKFGASNRGEAIAMAVKYNLTKD